MQDAFWDCFGDFQACNLNVSFGSSRFFRLGSRLLALVLKQKVYGISLGVVDCSTRVFVSVYFIYFLFLFVHFSLGTAHIGQYQVL